MADAVRSAVVLIGIGAGDRERDRLSPTASVELEG